MVDVPAETPTTIPVLPTVAYVVADDVHVPPDEASVSGILLNAHTEDRPLIVPATGSGLTVIAYVAVTRPQPLTTV